MALLRVHVLSIFAAAACTLLVRPGSCTTTRRHDAAPLHQDLVTQLPGQPGVGFRHYAGYATVDEKNGRALFYWFFEAPSGSDEKPLVLWLNGGPGCSSVGYGATQEIGPFLVDGEGYALKFNPYSWNKVAAWNSPPHPHTIKWRRFKVHEANLLFLESPVGVGFSYSNTSSDYDILGDSFAANDAYSFLHEWYKKFPSYRNRSFYIAGESYAGKYVPELAELIFDKNNDTSLFIDLKGFLLGNPETSDAQDWQGFVDYAWSHAIISDSTYKITKDNCDFYSNDTWSNEKCKDAVDELLRQYKFIDMYSLYTPVCTQNSTSTDNGVMQSMMLRRSSNMMPRIMGNGYNPCLDLYAKTFYNRPDVQKALHVIRQGQGNKSWSICNNQIFDEWKDSNPSLLPIYKKLIEGGLRIWVYSGDTDGRVPVLATRYCLNDLGLPVVGPWRPWYHQKQVRGWLQEYQGLTFATFRGAGHAVPVFEPSSSLALFASFLAGQPPSSG